MRKGVGEISSVCVFRCTVCVFGFGLPEIEWEMSLARPSDGRSDLNTKHCVFIFTRINQSITILI